MSVGSRVRHGVEEPRQFLHRVAVAGGVSQVRELARRLEELRADVHEESRTYDDLERRLSDYEEVVARVVRTRRDG